MRDDHVSVIYTLLFKLPAANTACKHWLRVAGHMLPYDKVQVPTAFVANIAGKVLRVEYGNVNGFQMRHVTILVGKLFPTDAT